MELLDDITPDWDRDENWEADLNEIGEIMNRGNLTVEQQRYFWWALRKARMYPHGEQKIDDGDLFDLTDVEEL